MTKLEKAERLALHYAEQIAELENKIADIKANCDLAIEGRDIKIMELEQQIEKMKCCANCKWLPMINETITACKKCNNKNKWELRK